MDARSVLAAACALAAGLYARPARACTCLPPPPPEKAREEADAVFEGRMFAQAPEGDQRIRYEFEVTRVFKGDVPMRVAVVSHRHSATCGRHFEVGTTYLVYARSRDGVLEDNLCSRTRPTGRADEDRAVLGAGRPPAADAHSDDGQVQEPPRVPPPPDGPEPAPDGTGGRQPSDVAPPPAAPARRGCAMGRPDRAPRGLLPVAVAFLRRRRYASTSQSKPPRSMA